MSAARPFDDILNLIATMPAIDAAAVAQVLAAGQMGSSMGVDLRPIGWLLTPLSEIAGWQGHNQPSLSRPLIAVFAGTHGVAQGLMPSEGGAEALIKASQARVKSLSEGSAAIRGMAGNLGAAYKVYEFGLEHPSEDFTQAPSLSERDCAAAMAFGMEVVAEGADIIALGNAGLGAATAAAAISVALYGGTAAYWAGGANAEARIAAVNMAMETLGGSDTDPLMVLRNFGGRDIAGMVGAILAARHQNIPILLDGFVVCAAAAILHAIEPQAVAHCFAAHKSGEPGHDALLSRLGLTPILDLDMNIGDGSGAALALSVLQTAAAGLGTLEVPKAE